MRSRTGLALPRGDAACDRVPSPLHEAVQHRARASRSCSLQPSSVSVALSLARMAASAPVVGSEANEMRGPRHAKERARRARHGSVVASDAPSAGSWALRASAWLCWVLGRWRRRGAPSGDRGAQRSVRMHLLFGAGPNGHHGHHMHWRKARAVRLRTLLSSLTCGARRWQQEEWFQAEPGNQPGAARVPGAGELESLVVPSERWCLVRHPCTTARPKHVRVLGRGCSTCVQEKVSRPMLTKLMWAYFKQNKLMDPADKR